MAQPRNDDLAKSRRESAELIGLDADRLTPADTLRCDLISTLRLVIDDAGATVLDGSSTDLGRLITATESLIKLLPNRELPPPSREGGPDDPRQRLWEMYSTMRARGAAAGLGYDGLKLTNEKLTAEIEQLRAEIAQLKGEPVPPEPAPPTPLPAVLSRPAQKSAPVASAAPSPERMSLRNDISPSPSPPAASAAPLPPTAEERQRALAIANSPVPQHVRDTRPQNEPWRPYVEGSAFHDRWSNRNF
jgi:hypothetical protein